MSQDEAIIQKLSFIETMVPEDPRYHKIYGVHVYWAKKPANVVAYCIENFSSPGDVVLDPFAGVGVVPIEALRLRRKGIGIDLCPLAVFIMEKSAMPCDELTIKAYKEKFFKNLVESAYQEAIANKKIPKNDKRYRERIEKELHAIFSMDAIDYFLIVEDLIKYITSGPVVLMVVEGPSAVKVVRALVGSTDGRKATPGTIRGDFSLDIRKNIVHAADSKESAIREISIHFKEDEIINYKRVDEEIIFPD